VLGDAILGTYLSKPYPCPPAVGMGVHSRQLLSKFRPFFDEIAKKYATEELYKIYGRGFLGIMSGCLYYDIFSQTVSPFLDVDFLSYCYSIPEKYKFKEQIYLDWIAAKHPEFARFAWEKTGVSPLISNNYKKYFYFGYYRRMSKKFFDMLSGKIKSGMNPFDLWLEGNSELRKYFDDYFEKNIDLLNNWEELKQDCKNTFKIGNSIDKFTILSLLSAIKLHWVND
jgi:asparagine synthase (glutamine-hydrolysing)